jgi:hypothetical protein
VVYWIDDTLFERYGVVAIESKQPKYPEEREISIRPGSGRMIPSEVIIRIEHFD